MERFRDDVTGARSKPKLEEDAPVGRPSVDVGIIHDVDGPGQKARRTRTTMLAGPTLAHIVRARVRAACRASWQKQARPDASELARSMTHGLSRARTHECRAIAAR